MKKTLTALFTLLGTCAWAQGERDALDLSSHYDDQGNAIIEVERHDGGTYSMILEFFDVSNLSIPKFYIRTVSSVGPILTLKPQDTKKSTSFRYRYQYVRGTVNPRKVNRDFIYRLPVSLATSIEARELLNAYTLYFSGKSHSVDFKAYQFIMERGDTVFAARKGVVISVVDKYDPITDRGEISMNSENNRVMVEHADGTIATYGVLAKGNIAVQPGDKVYPGTPIALAGTFDGEVYQTRFMLYYLTDNLSRINSLTDYAVTNHGIDPLFSTSEGATTLTHGTTYTPTASPELVAAEMTKRERRAAGL